MNDRGLDKNGNVIYKGQDLIKQGKSKEDAVLREIGILNNMAYTGNNDAGERAAIRARQIHLLKTLGLHGDKLEEAKKQLILRYENDAGGFFGSNGLVWGLREMASTLTGNKKLSAGNVKSPIDALFRHPRDWVTTNVDLDDLADDDVKNSTTRSMNDFYTRAKANYKKADEGAAKYVQTTIRKSISIDPSLKENQALESYFKSYVPDGAVFNKDSNVKLTMTPDKQSVEVVIPTKVGKDNSTHTAVININSLPPQVSNLMLNGNGGLYDANSTAPLKFHSNFSLPKNNSEVLERVKKSGDSEELLMTLDALDRGGIPTYDNMMSKLKIAYGEAIVNKHKTEIDRILTNTVNISNDNVGGQWVTKITQQGSMRRSTPDVASEYIESQIKNVLLGGY